LLAGKSEEGKRAGLGWIDAECVRLKFSGEHAALKVQHMGWNLAKPRRTDSLFRGFETPPRFYFVHSFHVVCRRDADVLATTTYGGEIVSAVEAGNVRGVQ